MKFLNHHPIWTMVYGGPMGEQWSQNRVEISKQNIYFLINFFLINYLLRNVPSKFSFFIYFFCYSHLSLFTLKSPIYSPLLPTAYNTLYVLD